MDATNKLFLAVMKAALLGVPADLGELTAQQWHELFALARIHQVVPLVYEAVYPDLQKADRELSAQLRRYSLHQVMVQTVKTSTFLELNRALRAAGVKPLVVKGLVCRDLYPNPDLRPSGDEDVLIPESQFDLCHREMLAFGMHTTEQEPDLAGKHEVPYRMEGSPLYIELHKQLFPPESAVSGGMNRFFDRAHENSITLTLQGEPVGTLSHTDHLLYLICHAFKHFLYSGFGIRQVCDIVLYANRYGSQVNWLLLLDRCRKIRADRFAAALFAIGEKYLVFDPGQAAWPEAWRRLRVDEGPMLEDLLCGGLYGDATMSRKHSSRMTLAAAADRKQGKIGPHSLAASVFPSAGALEGRYPYLKGRPWLVPVAWSQRLWTYSRETKNQKNNNAADALKIGRERIALMNRYGIVD